MTRQEMFEKSVRGLASQGYRQSRTVQGAGQPGEHVRCAYNGKLDDGTECHCAWGWVDPDIPASYQFNSVSTLYYEKIGVAGTLSGEDRFWALDLQACHDAAVTPDQMVKNLRVLAARFNLQWPDDVPRGVPC